MTRTGFIHYIGRRLVRAVLLLLGISALSFCLFQIVPGDYFEEMRLNPLVSTETVALLRAQHGFNDLMALRYVRWLGSVVRGDWGQSVMYHSPVASLLWQRACNTLLLSGTAAFFAWAMAIPTAVWAVRGRKWRRFAATAFTAVFVVIPDLFVILVLTFLAGQFHILPVGGMTSLNFDEMNSWRQLRDVAAHVAIPGTVLALAMVPALLSHARTALTEILQLPFIAAARANGIPPRRILLWHVLPAAANPLITLLGFSLGTLLSSSLLVEAIVGWPGLGRLLLDAILQRDLYVVIAAVMLSAVFLVSGNLIADILLYVVDPRIREEG